jgi:hypothetical protein
MAEFRYYDTKVDFTKINGGKRYENGDGVNAETINTAVESSAFAQALAINQPNTEEAGLVGTPTVSIEKTEDGSPRLVFSHLKGERGDANLDFNFYKVLDLSYSQGSYSSIPSGELVEIENAARIRAKVVSADKRPYVLRTNDDISVLLCLLKFNGSYLKYSADSPWYKNGDLIEIPDKYTHFGLIAKYKNNSPITPDIGKNIELLYYAVDKELSETSENPVQNKVVTLALKNIGNNIIARNKDVEHIVNAGANYGYHGNGTYNLEKRFTMLVTTDVHQSITRMNEAITYLNSMEAIDCGICLGDMAAAYFSDTDGTWYRDIIEKSNKPFMTVIGNHDMGNTAKVGQSATVSQAVQKWIIPNVGKIGDTTINKSYYKKDFDDYKIRVIVLNSYDTPDTLLNDTTFLVDRRVECYSQEQIDWFVSTLQNTPAEYHVLICSHYSASNATKDFDIPFNHSWRGFPVRDPQNGVISDIVNAFTNGTSIIGSYSGISSGVPTVTVDTDFTYRGVGNLIGFLSGHLHWDCVGHITNHPTQNAFAFSATADGASQNIEDELPRQDGTKAIDAITTISVDTTARKIFFTRIGSNVSNVFTKREPTVISY